MHLAMQSTPCTTGQVHLLVSYKAEKLSVRHVEVRMKVINASLTVSNLKLSFKE